MSKTATITFGLPASGKSTWIKKNCHVDMFVISADEIKKEFPGYTDTNHAEFYKSAVLIAEQRVYSCVESEKAFTFDAGSINSEYSERILRMLKSRGYHITFVVMNTPIDVCIERDKIREQSVGEEVIRAKQAKRSESLGRLISLLDSYDLIFIGK